ncbi:uncharacterized protein KQ657_002943 [Scheffersomyces spartinae]|uniref:XPG-I domain-containing protein n=1 Tax=Scheffersomyces spartinae TaxID=45513 RepID=A0A9P7V5J3_9ASCO|nr:uncharacterized protein KQ657_002943 [Scheffersomyces spartinae]KAG7191672.1 hypothetical protein KQ657_002943 [Scheffersomyces spartinae]
MGIIDLWDIVIDSDAQLGRVSLSQFVVDHYRNHPSPPTVAVDGNILLLGSTKGSGTSSELQDKITIGNFTAKLLALSALGITYVVVFDGIYKPYKLRHDHGNNSNYDQLRSMYMSHEGDEASLGETGYPLIDKTIAQLKNLGIQYLFCPAEAEAQCAYYQMHGVVDYVITNDSDCFAFGATKVLRNMTREDNSDQYNVTVFDINDNKVWTRNSFIFLASLRGGDYSEGVRSLGSKRSAALVSSNLEWTHKFIECFIEHESIKDSEVRESLILEFSQNLLNYVENNAKKIFGMRFIPKSIQLSSNFPLFYLKPLVLETPMEFATNCLSNAKIEDERQFQFGSKLGDFPIKYLIIKLIQLSSAIQYISITRDKLIGLIPNLMVKYEEDRLRDHFDIRKRNRSPSLPPSSPLKKSPKSPLKSPLKSPKRGDYVWLPRVIVQRFNKEIVMKYDRQKSPNKQSTTLDHFKQFSPTKKDHFDHIQPLSTIPKLTHSKSELQYSPNKKKQLQPVFTNYVSPTRSPRKKQKKNAFLPGQKSVDTFFSKLNYFPTKPATVGYSNEEEDNPFFVSSPKSTGTTSTTSTGTTTSTTSTGTTTSTTSTGTTTSTSTTGTTSTTANTSATTTSTSVINLISSEADTIGSTEQEQPFPIKAGKTVSLTESLLSWSDEEDLIQ